MRLICFLLILLAPITVCAKPLIFDISDHVINIDTSFTGKDLLLFGARNGGGDIVVVLRGPKESYIVRKKERYGGIWINRSQVRFDDVDGFYALASTRPIAELTSDGLMHQYQIGYNHMLYTIRKKSPMIDDIMPYKDALWQAKEASGLYITLSDPITFVDNVLFRTAIHFPETIPPGMYHAETYLINHGELRAMRSVPIIIRKTGIDAEISDAARNHPNWYGLMAVLMALTAGWVASVVFKKI